MLHNEGTTNQITFKGKTLLLQLSVTSAVTVTKNSFDHLMETGKLALINSK